VSVEEKREVEKRWRKEAEEQISGTKKGERI
jgi:hypothetical protein